MAHKIDMADWEAEQRKKDKARSKQAEALSKLAEQTGQFSQTLMRAKQKRDNDRFPDSERVKWEKDKRRKK